jgi:hypothetical protein
MLVAATTVAALLIASPSATVLDRIAADSGFLLGNAHRCGIATDRVVQAGDVVRQLIASAAADDNERDQAALRFAQFFLVSAVPDTDKEKMAASCDVVTSEFEKFEQHQTRLAAEAGKTAAGDTTGPPLDPGAGE